LQTERDKMRLMDGLSSASSQAGTAFDAAKTDEILSSLSKRVFYLNNVNQNTPILFQTRWALSYLRGPLTREQIKALTAAGPAPEGAEAATDAAKPKVPNLPVAAARPVLPPDVVQKFLPPRGDVDGLMYYPHLCVATKIRFLDAKAGVDETVDRVYLTPIKDDNTPVEWRESQTVDLHPDELENDPVEGIGYAEVTGAATKAKSYAGWQKDLATHIYSFEELKVFSSPDLKLFSNPDEKEADFRARIEQQLREERDAEVADLQKRYQPKIDVLEERIRRAQAAKEREEQERSSQMLSAGISVLGGVLGAVFGRGSMLTKTNIGKAASAAKQASKVLKEQGDVGRAAETVEALTAQLAQLQQQVEAETAAIAAKMDAAKTPVTEVAIKPKKTNISLGFSALVWAPCRPVSGSDPVPSW
jgi:hypothetical protein